MKSWNRIPVIDNPVVVTIGNFDGVHIGHQALLGQMRALSACKEYVPVVVTFKNHPLYLIDPERAPRMLMDIEEKTAVMKQAGAAHMIVLSFDSHLASTEPENFIKELAEKMNVRHIVVGFNFRFGRNGAGDGSLLAAMGTSLGFEVTVMPPVIYDGKPVSSSRIRGLLTAGDCQGARNMLGRPYSLTGMVTSGHGIGRKLEFPTANIEPEQGILIPGKGVYATGVTMANKWYGAMTNVGIRPTARRSEENVSIESHILGFDGMIYNERIKLEFYSKIREEKPFDSWKALKTQLKDDRVRIENAADERKHLQIKEAMVQ